MHKGFSVRVPICEAGFRDKLAMPPPLWMAESIRRDLAPYAEGVDRRRVDALFRGERIFEYKLVRFTVADGRISVAAHSSLLDKRHFRHVLAVMERLHALARLPDVDFVLSIEDGFNVNPGFPACPCFVFSKVEGLAPFVLMPDFKALTGYPTLQREVGEGGGKYPWERKQDLAFWRGTTTGGHLTREGWSRLARLKLVLLSLQHPGDIDARITGIAQCDPGVSEVLKARGLMGSKVGQKDHLRYKYLIDVDGNACTFERYFWTLLSNSVVLKQVTPNRQWYYGALEPYRHYIPVKEDLSDLLEQIAWAREHDGEARRIAENGADFVRNNLSIEDNFLYLYHLILAYARLQANVP